MIGALGSSLIGIQNATKRFEASAQNIANPGATQDASGNQVPNDTTQDIVDLSVAAREFEANVKVIQVEDKIAQSLLDILA